MIDDSLVFHIRVPTCCDRWKLVDTEQVTDTVTRSTVECPGCGHTRVLTVTSRAVHPALEVIE